MKREKNIRNGHQERLTREKQSQEWNVTL